MATSREFNREIPMALVDGNRLGSAFVICALAFLLGIPIIGMVGSVVFGMLSLICALTKTDSWLNAVYAVIGFVGYWVVILLIIQMPKLTEGFVMMFVGSSIYSLFWIIWMRKTTKVLAD